MNSPSHSWRFYRSGGLDQVRLDRSEDIAALAQLDPKLWVALACPVKGLEFDERTLALIDTDKDGRVRQPEIVAAVEFLKARLRNLDTLLAGSDALPLAALNPDTPDGQSALAAARRILANLGKTDAAQIAFSDIADPSTIFAGTRFNGDGVITPESAETPELAAVIRQILETQGSVADRSGVPGVDQTLADAFFTEAAALDAWAAQGAASLPFGDGTAAAYAAVSAVRAKVDDYFARCRLAAFDERALAALNRAETEYLQIAAGDMTLSAQELAGFPLARIVAGQPLPLEGALNPGWAAAIAQLRAAVPALAGKSAMTESEWTALNAQLAAYATWSAAKPVTKIEALGIDAVRALLTSGTQTRINDLILRDAALEAETAGIDAVEKLVRLNRDFVRLLHNFVSFGDFYSRQKLATFQVGRLYLDSRECHLCIRVEDAGKHAALAGLSRCYLAYCDLTRRGGAEKMQVLAVFTQGDSDFLMVGRNGLFVDRKGQDWDATISKVVDAPISIKQAFFSPYKKFVRMIEEQVAKRAAAADDAVNAKLAAGAEQVAHADKAAAAPKPEPKKLDLGTIALIGTAISGVAAMVGLVLEKFFGLGVYMPLGLLAIILLISGPSMLIAALKLRQRSLGPILDANGWAINGRVAVNIPFGTALTHAAHLPAGSSLSVQDPFAEKSSPWPKLLLVAALLGGGWYVLNKLGLI